MKTALFLIYIFGTPLLLMNLSRKWRWIDRVSPMTLLYIIGLFVANCTPFMTWSDSSQLNKTIQDLSVPMSIPLMLMACELKNWDSKVAIKTFITGLVAVLIVTVSGFFLFRGTMDNRDFAQVCASVTGQYTGGTTNVIAIAKAIDLKPELFLYLTSYDMVIKGIYLLFIVFFGKKVFRTLLPYGDHSKHNEKIETHPLAAQFPFSKDHIGHTLLVLGLAVVIAAISFVLSKLVSPNKEVNMTILILALTTLALCTLLIKPVRKQQQCTFDLGLYFVYVFCLTISSSINITTMEWAGSLSILYYIIYAIFGSLILQIIFARIWKIDGDNVVVGSIALLNSPPFVPMVAAVLGNRDVMMVGITIGLLGYMIGNYLGIGVYWLLCSF